MMIHKVPGVWVWGLLMIHKVPGMQARERNARLISMLADGSVAGCSRLAC